MNTNTLPPVIIYSSELSLEQLWAFPSFANWMTTLEGYASRGCRVEWVHVYGGTFFGIHHVQSLFVDARVIDVEGNVIAPTASEFTGEIEPSRIPCAGMLHGNTSSILFLLTEEETHRKYTLLVTHERALAGGRVDELPTGIIDAGGSFCGPHGDKIAYVLGSIMKITELHPLNPQATLASCSIVSQGIQYFLCERRLSRASMRAVQTRAARTFIRDGELEVIVTPYKVEQLPANDGKLWSAIGLLCRARPELLLEYGMVPMPSI